MAVNPIRILRNIVTGARPPSTRLDGEPYVNFADGQLGVMTGGVAQDMIGAPFFSAAAAYAAGQTVNYQGALYQSLAAITPGPWNATQWTAYSTATLMAELEARVRALELARRRE